METPAPPDVVGLAPADAVAKLVAAGWRVACRTTAWNGSTPGDLGRRLTQARVIAARQAEGTLELVVAGFPHGPENTPESGQGKGG